MAAARWSHSYVLACILIFSNGVESASPTNTSLNGESRSTITSGSTSTTTSSIASSSISSDSTSATLPLAAANSASAALATSFVRSSFICSQNLSSIDGNASAAITTTTSETSSRTVTNPTSTSLTSLRTSTSITSSIQSLSNSDSEASCSTGSNTASRISLQASFPITTSTFTPSSSGIGPVTSGSLSNSNGNTSENRPRSSSSTTASQTSPTTSISISHSTASIKSSPGSNFIVSTRIEHTSSTSPTATSSTTSSSSPTFMVIPSTTYIHSDVIPATSANLSLSPTPTALSAAAISSSSRFWNNRAAVVAVFVITALIALVLIGVCLFVVFKRCNARRRRYESFTDVVTHSRDPSSMTTPLNALSQEKGSSNVPGDVPPLSLFPFLFRQPKRASIKSFFSGPVTQPQLSNMTTPFQQEIGSSTIPDVLPDVPFSFWTPGRESPEPQLSNMTTPFRQEIGSSTIPDVLPDIPFSFWSPGRESPDSFFGGSTLHSRPF